MDFIQQTTTWVKGEIFEASLFGAFGLLTAIGSCLFWKNNAANAQTLWISLIIFGLTGLIIDYFSKIRADEYYKAIIQATQANQ